MSDFSALPRHEISLVIGGTAYLGWTQISVDVGIDAWAGNFDLTLAFKDRTDGEDFPLKASDECQIVLGGKALITGYIDRVSRRLDKEERSIRVTGRDKAGDLVDCSVIHPKGSWRNVKLDAIAKEIAEPFGVAINVSGEVGQPLTRFALQQGETVFAAIERLTRYRGLIAFSDGQGGLTIGNPDSGKVSGEITQGRNLRSIESDIDHSDRFSKYVVKGQASGSDERNGRPVAQIKAEASDSGMERYRPLLIVGEEQSDAESLKKRADWEAVVRAARGQRARATVPGWFAGNGSESGTVWEHGARAECDVPLVEFSGQRLIERVRFLRDDEEGTRTELDLVPPEAWTQLAEKEESANEGA